MLTSIIMLITFGIVILATLHSEGWGTAIRYCSSVGMMISGLGIVLPLIGF